MAVFIVVSSGDDLLDAIPVEVDTGHVVEVARIPVFTYEVSPVVEESELTGPARTMNRNHDDLKTAVSVEILCQEPLGSVVSGVSLIPIHHLMAGSKLPQRPALRVEAEDFSFPRLVLSLKTEQDLAPAIMIEVLDQKIRQLGRAVSSFELKMRPVCYLAAEVLQARVITPEDPPGVI